MATSLQERLRLEGPVAGTYSVLGALLRDPAGEPLLSGPELALELGELCEFVDTRRDCSDFRVLALLALELAGAVPDEAQELVTRTLVGFKYWMSEPGDDAMCFWSENHQLLFATCEYLAGATHPDQTFSNDRRLGSAHRDGARERLLRWLDLRFRFGFSEWLSPVYYEEDVAALTLLVDHAPDEDLAARATVVLDLLLLDCALHRFDGHLVASSGRLYEEQKKHPATAELRTVLDHAFTDEPVSADWNRLGMLFCLRRRYEVPETIRAIAREPGPRTVRTGHGLEIAQAAALYGSDDPETTGSLLWSMEAFVNPGAVRATMRAYDTWGMRTNPFLSGLAALEWVPAPLLSTGVRLVRPVVAGTALERAQVTTTRSDSYVLSAAQHYRPGEFGDQQHLWQVVLPGGVPIFATHPGGPLVDDATRQKTPSSWVGNGVNPDVGSVGPVLLAVYDTRGRRGFGEASRVRGSHLYVPFAELDETAEGSHWLAARRGEGLVGVLATSPLLPESDTARRQHGSVTGWVVICAELDDHGSLDAFCGWLARCSVELSGSRLTASTPDGLYRVHRGRTYHDGRVVPVPGSRFDTPWISAPYDADALEVSAGGGTLRLGRDGSRVVTTAP